MKIDQKTLICDLPDSEFMPGGVVANICSDAGFWWHPLVVVSNREAWNLPIGELDKIIRRQKIKNTKQKIKEFIEIKKWAFGALWWEVKHPELIGAHVAFVLMMLVSALCFFSAYIQICNLR